VSNLGRIHNELTRWPNQSQLHIRDYMSIYAGFVNEKSHHFDLRFSVNHNPKVEVEKLAIIGLILHELMSIAFAHQPLGEGRLKANVNVKQETGQ